jgi:hypothetical protein
VRHRSVEVENGDAHVVDAVQQYGHKAHGSAAGRCLRQDGF